MNSTERATVTKKDLDLKRGIVASYRLPPGNVSPNRLTFVSWLSLISARCIVHVCESKGHAGRAGYIF
jgi:hypothetical protein